MFADDRALVREMAAKYGPLKGPLVDVGGLARPCVADYQITIAAMAALGERQRRGETIAPAEVVAAQRARYLDIENPLGFLGDVVIENPETGGLPIAKLANRYNREHGDGIGTAILLSVLEHVADPFGEMVNLWDAMAPGGLVIVSVPFMFPEHHGPKDYFRFTPDGLRSVFENCDCGAGLFDVLETGWRLRIGADAGVLNLRTGRPHAIESCYLVARAVRL